MKLKCSSEKKIKEIFWNLKNSWPNLLTSPLRCAILRQPKELSENGGNAGSARFVANAGEASLLH